MLENNQDLSIEGELLRVTAKTENAKKNNKIPDKRIYATGLAISPEKSKDMKLFISENSKIPPSALLLSNR